MFKKILDTALGAFSKASEAAKPKPTPAPVKEEVEVNIPEMFTLDILAEIFPQTSRKVLARFVDPLNMTCDEFEIDTVTRAAAFIAQVGHESGGLNFTKENLNYSAASLMKVFGKYFNQTTANAYARNPERIASRVYANRMGNGNEGSKEGWIYRGRGLIQITGKYTYEKLAKYLNMTLSETCAYLETDEGAAISAGWFWDSNGLNELADANRFTDLTKRINGGTNGMEDRKAIWARAKKALA